MGSEIIYHRLGKSLLLLYSTSLAHAQERDPAFICPIASSQRLSQPVRLDSKHPNQEPRVFQALPRFQYVTERSVWFRMHHVYHQDGRLPFRGCAGRAFAGRSHRLDSGHLRSSLLGHRH